MKIIAMIPARKGSKRLKNKNLALLNGKPLIYYAIKEAKKTKIFKNIVLNSDDEIYSKIAKRYKISFYKRPKRLGGSKIKSDDLVYDFIKKFNCDILVWVNSIAPLQTYKEILSAINYFNKNKLNSLITSIEKKVHYSFKKKPVNFSLKGKFAQTQDLLPLQEMIYSTMIWTTGSFKKNMLKKNNAMIHGKFGLFNVNKTSSIIVKNNEDILIAESILKKNYRMSKNIKYDKILL